MKDHLNSLPQDLKALILLAKDVGSGLGIRLYLVGGFVRDLLLGVNNFDLDIVAEGDGIRFAEDFANRLQAKLVRHRRFGTATIIINGLKVDIASSRLEYYPQPACLPSVRSGSLRDDLKRRDFSINAMSVSLNADDYGRLIDFFNGQSDLNNKLIRVLHDLSFVDDPTRILRAIRFEQRYDFRIEKNTLKNLKSALKLQMLQKVQPQRLRDELILLLKEDCALKSIRRLDSLGAINFISPKLVLTKDAYKLLAAVSVQIKWFKLNCPRHRKLDTWLIYFMAVIDRLNLKDLKPMLKDFAFTGGQEKRIMIYKKINKAFISVLERKDTSPSRIFRLLDPLSYEVMLLIKAKFRNKCLNRHIAEFLSVHHLMRLHLTGHDLRALGLVPGPQYQRVFKFVFNAKLDGQVNTAEEELNLVREFIARFKK